MISPAGQRFMAVAESVSPWLDDQQAARAIRFLMELVSEGGPHAALEKRRQLEGRADRDARGVDE
jgi:hypothetical protein